MDEPIPWPCLSYTYVDWRKIIYLLSHVKITRQG